MGNISNACWRGVQPSGRSVHNEPHDNEHDRTALMNDLCRLGLLPIGMMIKRHTKPHEHLLRHFAGDLRSSEDSTHEYIAERRARRALAENRRNTKNTGDFATADHRRRMDELVSNGRKSAIQRSVRHSKEHIKGQRTRPAVSQQTFKNNRIIANAIAQGFIVDGLAYTLADRLITGNAEECAGIEDFLSALNGLSPRIAEELRGAVDQAIANLSPVQPDE